MAGPVAAFDSSSYYKVRSLSTSQGEIIEHHKAPYPIISFNVDVCNAVIQMVFSKISSRCNLKTTSLSFSTTQKW